MKMKNFSVVVFTLLLLSAFCDLGLCRGDDFLRMKLGGFHDCKGTQNSAEIESLARFAVQEHNKKENALVEFARVLKAKEQVVAGKIYYLTLEVIDAGKKKIYEAKVWVKPWLNFKQLQEFKQAEEGPSSFTPLDLGVKRAYHGEGWQAVPTNDPEVQNAANHALKSIQQRSNSLFPYELTEILNSKAKVGISAFAFFPTSLSV
ncbi:hypothetical protein SLEP1_g37982 [Rubroshorea leprosula]|uniref:Cysteine proteinase inhibitor n=1 Tax=Rubroshorea leprosula TaxID=152421 RepID=A0AAV5KWI8_9ROSI|nr:hypothetical protein SLEP1_g37982 [Rubroshorea leprosula]